MSKVVDLTRPITDEEREYLMTRARESEVEANDRQFGHLKDAERRNLQDRAEEADAEEAAIAEAYEEGEEFDPELVAQVAPLTVKELEARIKKLGHKPDGDKETLQIQLLEILETQAGE